MAFGSFNTLERYALIDMGIRIDLLDQMFTEEQFEAYRALSFHAAYGLFAGSDKYAYLDLKEDLATPLNAAVLNGLFGGVAVGPPA
jgi:hypothetical protein